MRCARPFIGLFLAACLPLTACAGSPATTLSGDPAAWLVTLNQLGSPDFTVEHAAAPVSAAQLGNNTTALTQAASSGGFQAGARVSYLRPVVLSTANGPVEVLATAARFGDAGGAHTWLAAYQQDRDGIQGMTAISTGPLGDEAFATSVTATAAGGTTAVQIVIAWRTANVVNVVIARGRDGGTRLDDALYLARQQAADETG